MWHSKQYCDMNSEEQEIAAKEWGEAEEPGAASFKDPAEGEEPSRALSEEDVGIQSRMKDYMTKSLKWTHKELNDAVVIAGISAPETPSMVNYFAALHHQFGDDKLGFLPQNWQSHTKQRIQDVLRCLGRTGLKLGWQLSEKRESWPSAWRIGSTRSWNRVATFRRRRAKVTLVMVKRTPPTLSTVLGRSREIQSKFWSSIQEVRRTCHQMLSSRLGKLRARSVTCRRPTTMPISLKRLTKTRKKKRWH